MESDLIVQILDR